MSMWHYVQAGVKNGPVSTEQIRAMIGSGQLQPTDSVWREGMSGWALVSQVPEFAGTYGQAASAPHVSSGPPAFVRSEPEGNFAPGLRIMAIIGAALTIIAFFVPYFYVWASPRAPKEVMAAADATELVATGLPFGWSFWWSILIFILAFLPLTAAILDLALRSRLVRSINRWVMLGSFAVITILALTFLILAIFGISLGSVYLKGKNEMQEPRQLSEVYGEVDRMKQSERSRFKNLSKEEREKAERMMNETYISVSAIPIGSAVAVIGGGLGLIASLLVVTRKS